MTRRRSKQRAAPRDNRVLAGVGVASALAAAIVFYGAWRQRRISHANQATTCTVVTSRIDYNSRDRQHAYAAEVVIAHELDGHRYQRTDTGDAVRDRNDAQRQLSRYPVGGQVRCYYVEGSPDQVTVFRTQPGMGLVWFGVFLLVLPGIFFVIERRRS